MTETNQAPADNAPGKHTDDLTILDDDELWRRIHYKQWIRDDKLGRVRPTSKAFQSPSDGSPMSVVLAKEHSNPESYLEKYEEPALASITAGLARECSQGVAREPLPDEPAHAVVFGRKIQSVRRRFAKEASWVIPPTTS
jgi:hypothetical protein